MAFCLYVIGIQEQSISEAYFYKMSPSIFAGQPRAFSHSTHNVTGCFFLVVAIVKPTRTYSTCIAE